MDIREDRAEAARLAPMESYDLALSEDLAVASFHINYKFFTGCVLLFVAMAVGVHFLHAFQVNRTASVFRERAHQLLQAEKPREAMGLLNSYLKLEPDDIESRAELARLRLKTARNTKEYIRAYLAYEELLRLAPELHEDRRRLIELLIFQAGRYGDARKHVEWLLKRFASDGQLHFYAGLCYESEGNAHKAAEHYHAAIQNGYRETEVFTRLVGLYRGPLGSPEKADDVVETMVSFRPKSADVLYTRALYMSRYKTPKEALDATNAVLREHPEHLDSMLLQAKLMLVGPPMTEAERDQLRLRLTSRLAKDSDDPRPLLLLAELEHRVGNSDAALAVLRRAQNSSPDNAETLVPLIDLLLRRGQLPEARRKMEQLRELKTLPAATAAALEGRILMAERKYPAAAEQLESAYYLAFNRPDLKIATTVFLGECYAAMGAHGRQLGAYRRARGLDALLPEAVLGMADAYAGLGRFDEALAACQVLDKTPSAQRKIAELLFARSARLPPSQRNWPAVLRALAAARTTTQDSLPLDLIQAEIFAAQGRQKELREWLTRLRKQHPTDVRVRVALVQLALQKGDASRAAELLKRATEELGENALLRIAWADYWRRQPPTDAIGPLEVLLDGLDAFSEAEQTLVRKHVADVSAQLGDVSAALRIWMKIAAQQSYSIPAHMRVVQLAVALKDESATNTALESLRRLEGENGPHVAMAQALGMMSRRSNLPQVRRLLDRVLGQRPQWPLALATRGRLNDIEGNSENAYQDYRRATTLGLRDLYVLRRTTQLALSLQRYADVHQLLKDVRGTAGHTSLSLLRTASAEASLRVRDFAKVIDMVKQSIADDPSDFSNYVWLGQLSLAAGESKQSEQAFRQATRVAAHEPAPWIMLVSLLVNADRHSDAEAVVEEARSKLSKTEAGLAICYELIGDLEQSTRQFEAAAKAQPDDSEVFQGLARFYLRTNQVPKAVGVLQEAVAGKRNLDPATLRWSRRWLAQVISRRDYPGFLRGLKLLEQNAAEAPDDLPDLRAKAAILAGRREREHLQHAVEIIETLADRSVLSPDQRHSLARICDILGRTREADAQWQVLLAANGSEARFVVAYIERQLAKDALEDAATWIDRLRELPDSEPLVLPLQAQLFAQKDKSSEAIKVFKQWFESAENADDRRVRLLRSAALCEQSAKRSDVEDVRDALLTQSERWLRALVEQDASAAPMLAEFLARQGRVEEALSLLEQARSSLRPGQFTDAGIKVLRIGNDHGEFVPRVEKWLVDGANNQSLLYVVQLAELRAIERKYDEAAQLYRRVLSKAPNSVPDLNNLAWILSVIKKENAEAMRLIDRAIELAGPRWELLDTRASIFLNDGNIERAIFWSARAVEQADAPLARFHLAVELFQSGNLPVAKLHFRKAVAAGLTEQALDVTEHDIFRKLQMEFVD